MFFNMLLVFIILTSPFIYAVSFYERMPEGFLWYRDQKKAVERIKEAEDEKEQTLPQVVMPQVAIPQVAMPQVKAAQKRNQQVREAFEGAVEVFLDQPTLEHAIQAQRLQKEIFERSETVSNLWALAAITDPQLMDFKNNANLLDRELKLEQEDKRTLTKLRAFSKSWGLIFYWRRGCIFCEKFVPIIKELSKETGFQVLAVSEEGDALPGFEAKKETSFIKEMNPTKRVPVLYLVNQKGTQIYMVAHGLTNRDKIKANILLVMQHTQKPSLSDETKGGTL